MTGAENQIKGTPQQSKGGAADPKNKRRTCAALEATRTMKRPVHSPSQQGRVAYSGSYSLILDFCVAPKNRGIISYTLPLD
jgi:hypothetical protein